jgi:hypothetical protein
LTSPAGDGGRWIAGRGWGLASPLAAGFAFASGFASALALASGFASALAAAPSPVAFESALGVAFFGFAAGASVALAPLPSTLAASASSTLEDAVVTSRPAFWSAARTSFEGMSRSFAISWTRFFAMR